MVLNLSSETPSAGLTPFGSLICKTGIMGQDPDTGFPCFWGRRVHVCFMTGLAPLGLTPGTLLLALPAPALSAPSGEAH